MEIAGMMSSITDFPKGCPARSVQSELEMSKAEDTYLSVDYALAG
jgi:hypothetical protein